MATITKRGKSFRFRTYAGYDKDGKQIVHTRTWTPPEGWTDKRAEKEAKHQAELFEEEVRTGLSVDGRIKFAAFAELWLSKYAIPNLKPKTVKRYQELLQRINGSIGHIPLRKLAPVHLLMFYDDLRNEMPRSAPYHCKTDFKKYLKGRRITQVALAEKAGVSVAVLGNICRRKNISLDTALKICAALEETPSSLFAPVNAEKRLAGQTILHHHRMLSNILNDAVNWQYIPYNPCDRIDSPKATPQSIVYLDDVQSRQLWELLKDAPNLYRRVVRFDLLTGLRRGELCGIEWPDIDWQNKTIHIARAAQYLPDRGVYTETPKTKESDRLLRISDRAIEILREQLLWTQLQSKHLGAEWKNSNRIFCAEDGSVLNPDRLTRWFRKFISGTDLPPINIHSLRHTYATLCIAKGAPITAVSAQLGHSSVSTTANIYAHAIRSALISTANSVDINFLDILE